MTAANPPHDLPTAAGLVEAVRELLEASVLDATDGRVRYEVRVAVTALRIVERELAAGDGPAIEHAAGLAQLGYGSEADLAAAIRSGEADAHLEEVEAFVRRTVASKLSVANPAYLET